MQTYIQQRIRSCICLQQNYIQNTWLHVKSVFNNIFTMQTDICAVMHCDNVQLLFISPSEYYRQGLNVLITTQKCNLDQPPVFPPSQGKRLTDMLIAYFKQSAWSKLTDVTHRLINVMVVFHHNKHANINGNKDISKLQF